MSSSPEVPKNKGVPLSAENSQKGYLLKATGTYLAEQAAADFPKEEDRTETGNMLRRHQYAVADVAEAMNVVVMMKGISAASFKYREKGINVLGDDGAFKNHPVAAKESSVQGKTGPSGLVPVDQSLSKIGEYIKENPDLSAAELKEKQDDIAKYQKEVDDILASKMAKAVTVELEDGEKLDVLADVGGRPYVADYDLLTIGTPKELYSFADHMPFKALGYGTTNRHDVAVQHNLMEAIADMEVEAGRVSKRVYNYLSEKVHKSFLTVSVTHGTDATRPEGKGEKLIFNPEEPVVAITPERRMFLLSTENELVDFISDWRGKGYAWHENGFHIPVHKDWDVEVASEKEIPKIDVEPMDHERFPLGYDKPAFKVSPTSDAKKTVSPADVERNIIPSEAEKVLSDYFNENAAVHVMKMQSSEEERMLSYQNLSERTRWKLQYGMQKKEIEKIKNTTQRKLAEKILDVHQKALAAKLEKGDLSVYRTGMNKFTHLERKYQYVYGGRPSPVGREHSNHLLTDYLEARSRKNVRAMGVFANRILDDKHASTVIRVMRPPHEYKTFLQDVQLPLPEKYKSEILKSVEKKYGKNDPIIAKRIEQAAMVAHFQPNSAGYQKIPAEKRIRKPDFTLTGPMSPAPEHRALTPVTGSSVHFSGLMKGKRPQSR